MSTKVQKTGFRDEKNYQLFILTLTIAKNAPLSIKQVKKSIRYGSQMELKTAFRFEVESYNHLIDTADRIEGVEAFNEKRPAQFKGS